MNKSIAVRERLLAKVSQSPNGCWEWTATISRKGYAGFSYGGRTELAHRISYELFVGPIPDGLVLDHLCRVRHCVNPAHLEPVTSRVNILRGVSPSARVAGATNCAIGHEFTPGNTYTNPQGKRRCRKCRLDYMRVYRAAHPAARTSAA